MIIPLLFCRVYSDDVQQMTATDLMNHFIRVITFQPLTSIVAASSAKRAPAIATGFDYHSLKQLR
jgi:hypothetical protein